MAASFIFIPKNTAPARAVFFVRKTPAIALADPEVEMTINSKENCIHDLGASILRTMKWRRGLQAKYVDSRNGIAADILERLSVEAAGLTDEVWSELKPFYSWASGTWADAVSLASRRIAFQSRAQTFPTYVDELIGILAEQL